MANMMIWYYLYLSAFIAQDDCIPSESIEMQHFSQADPQWAKRILGRNSTFKQAGCAITCLAMIASDIAEAKVTPDKIDGFLDGHKGYSGDSVIWDKAVLAIRAYGGDEITHWEHVTPLHYDPASCKYAIFRVKTARNTLHYVVDLKDGYINDPGHANGENTTLQEQGYILDRVTIFC